MITGYDQIMRVDLFSTIPSTAPEGSYVWAEDTARTYKIKNGLPELIPNQTEMVQASRKAYQTGVMKMGAYPYLAKATSVSGVITFWITDNGLSTGNAVFTDVLEDGISISPYGTANAYQISSPVLSADKKKITANIKQAQALLLGLVTTTTAADGIDCRLIAIGI